MSNWLKKLLSLNWLGEKNNTTFVIIEFPIRAAGGGYIRAKRRAFKKNRIAIKLLSQYKSQKGNLYNTVKEISNLSGIPIDLLYAIIINDIVYYAGMGYVNANDSLLDFYRLGLNKIYKDLDNAIRQEFNKNDTIEFTVDEFVNNSLISEDYRFTHIIKQPRLHALLRAVNVIMILYRINYYIPVNIITVKPTKLGALLIDGRYRDHSTILKMKVVLNLLTATEQDYVKDLFGKGGLLDLLSNA